MAIYNRSTAKGIIHLMVIYCRIQLKDHSSQWLSIARGLLTLFGFPVLYHLDPLASNIIILKVCYCYDNNMLYIYQHK